ncbi:hypothetical protein Peur_032085 [Populus x canadensis]
MSRVSFTRVMIEVDLSVDLLHSVNLSMPDGTTIKQRVIYEFLLKFYSHCCMSGHTNTVCLKLNIGAEDSPTSGMSSRDPYPNAERAVTGSQEVVRRGKKAKLLPQHDTSSQHELPSTTIIILDDSSGSDLSGNGKFRNVLTKPPSAKSSRGYMTWSKGLLPLALHDTGLGISTGSSDVVFGLLILVRLVLVLVVWLVILELLFVVLYLVCGVVSLLDRFDGSVCSVCVWECLVRLWLSDATAALMS